MKKTPISDDLIMEVINTLAEMKYKESAHVIQKLQNELIVSRGEVETPPVEVE